MSRKSPAEKLAEKRTVLVERTAKTFGISAEEAVALLSTVRQQSVRINTLRGPEADTLTVMQCLGWQGTAYPWADQGYSVDMGLQELRDSTLVTEGKIYIQNAASWLPVLLLGAQPGESILDVCAAPGGKTTHIAAVTSNQAAILANDNSRTRLMKLQATCERLDAKIDRFTMFDAQRLAQKLAGEQFDRILIDAPCSGEGLMQFSRNKDFDTWSVAQIKRLQQLQKRILTQAWHLLKPGGTLVYSTCTMPPEENEAVIDYALRRLEGSSIQRIDIDLPNRVPAMSSWNGKEFSSEISNCLRLKPSKQIEAFFVARLIKLD